MDGCDFIDAPSDDAGNAYDSDAAPLRRVFCWLPTPVYSSLYWRDGFRWLTFVWRDADGKCYVSAEAAR